MANYCSIKNKKNEKPEKILRQAVDQLNEKFDLGAKGRFYKKEESFVVTINKLSFVFFLTNKEIQFYDCPDCSLTRHNDDPYLKTAYKNGMFYAGVSSAYCFIYQYLKHQVATNLKSKLYSDGSGTYSPDLKADKFKSFLDWMDYCESCVKKNPKIVKLIRALSIPSKTKIIKEELKRFPQLSPKETP